MEEKRKFEREIEDSVFVKKEKCRLLFFELDILGLHETFILGVAWCFDNLFIIFICRCRSE